RCAGAHPTGRQPFFAGPIRAPNAVVTGSAERIVSRRMCPCASIFCDQTLAAEDGAPGHTLREGSLFLPDRYERRMPLNQAQQNVSSLVGCAPRIDLL